MMASSKGQTATPKRSTWRPGNGLAVLRPGQPSVQVGKVPSSQETSVIQRQVRASLRSLRLQPSDLERTTSPMLPKVTCEEKLTLEFSTLEGNIALARLVAMSPSPLELERVGQQVRGMLEGVRGNLIIDVTDIGSLHCAVINWLLDMRQTCSRFGGHMMLTGLSSQAHDMLISTGLARKLHLADTAPEAHAMLLDVQRRLAA